LSASQLRQGVNKWSSGGTIRLAHAVYVYNDYRDAENSGSWYTQSMVFDPSYVGSCKHPKQNQFIKACEWTLTDQLC
jgi:hypothetical protein